MNYFVEIDRSNIELIQSIRRNMFSLIGKYPDDVYKKQNIDDYRCDIIVNYNDLNIRFKTKINYYSTYENVQSVLTNFKELYPEHCI